MAKLDAVLLDWSGTLVRYPRGSWRLRRALAAVGRSLPDEEVAATMERLAAAFGSAGFREAARDEDCSAERHREVNMAALAAFSDLEGLPPFPDAPVVLRELRDRGLRVAVVSNIHFDIRPQFVAAGLADTVDSSWASRSPTTGCSSGRSTSCGSRLGGP